MKLDDQQATMGEGSSTPRSKMVERPDSVIEVLVQGQGKPIVLLPSLGRGAHDFDPIADHLARGGFRVLRPQRVCQVSKIATT